MTDKILKIINEVLIGGERMPINSLKLSDNLRDDFGLSSFDLAELTVRIEEEFGVDIFETGLVNTIDEIITKIKNFQDD